MSNPYVGEIRMFGGNFAPAGWAMCNGQLLAIAENAVLYNLIGTTYGGNGQTTFAVPDMRGRVMLHEGTGDGLSTRVIGQVGGAESVTLTGNQLPLHTHTAQASSSAVGAVTSPAGNVWSVGTNTGTPQFAAGTATPRVAMAAGSVPASGAAAAPHENRVPYLAVSFIISLFGIFPSQ